MSFLAKVRNVIVRMTDWLLVVLFALGFVGPLCFDCWYDDIVRIVYVMSVFGLFLGAHRHAFPKRLERSKWLVVLLEGFMLLLVFVFVTVCWLAGIGLGALFRTGMDVLGVCS